MMSDFTDMVEVAAHRGSLDAATLPPHKAAHGRRRCGRYGKYLAVFVELGLLGHRGDLYLSIRRRDRAAAYTPMLRPCRLRLRRL
jgi:hypothetical protein